MGKETVYCSVCGDRISSSDFEMRRAMTVLDRHFCRKCAVTVAREASEGSGRDSRRTPPPWRARNQRIPIADTPTRALGNKVPFLIAAAVGLIALMLLLYVFMSKRSS